MEARLGIKDFDLFNGTRKKKMQQFTSYQEANKVLNDFALRAEAEQIWISVDAADLGKNQLGDRFCQMLELVLDYALTSCVESSTPKNRFVRIRCRNMQNQLFLKIEYSNEEGNVQEFDKRIIIVKEMINNANGYFKIQKNKGFIDIKISVGMK